MQTFLQILGLTLALAVPWVTHSQDIADYTFANTTTTFSSIAATGTSLSALQIDDASVSVALPFTFNFGSESCTSVMVSSNAQIGIGSANPTSNMYEPHYNSISIIVPMGHDMNIDSIDVGGHVYWEVQGTAPNRTFVVEYNNIQPYSMNRNSHYTFQVCLHENGNIDFIYDTCVSDYSQTNYCFIRDHSATSYGVVSGTWTNPTCTFGTGYSTATLPVNSTNVPAVGQMFTFTRPVVTCPKPSNFAVSNIHPTAADLSWIETGTATAWVLEYSDTAFVPGTCQGTLVNVTDTSYSFTALTPGSTYHVYLHSNCGSGDTSANRYLSFTTPLTDPVSTFPWQCNFTDTSVIGWELVNGTQTNKWVIGGAAHNGGVGDSALYVSNDSGVSNAYTISSTSNVYAYREMILESGQYAVQYDWRAQGESCCDYIQAAIIPSTTAIVAGNTMPSGVVRIDGGVNLNMQSSWQTKTTVFTIPTDGNYRLVFLWHNDGSVGTTPAGGIDNITLTQLTCPQPTALASTPTTSELAITWTAGGSESSWIVTCGTTEAVATTNSYTFQNLSAATADAVSVRAMCGDGDSSFVTSGVFRTSCAPTISIPFVENFDGFAANARPACWQYSGYVSTYPYVSTSYHASGSNSLYMYDYFPNATSTNRTYIVSPAIDTTVNPIRGLQTTFKYLASTYSSSYYPGTMIVGIMTDSSDFNTFYPIDTVYSTAAQTWAEAEVNFNTYPDSLPGRFIAYVSVPVGFTSSYAYNYIYLDDISINNIPTCLRPTSIVSTGNTSSSVSLAWTDALGSAWEVAYGATGFNPDTAVVGLISNLTSDSLVVTGLTAGTSYDFYVRTDCGNSDYSLWRGPVTSTPGSFNMAATGTASITGCGLTIYDNGGPTGIYATSCNSTLTVYPSSPDSVIVIQGTYTGESCCDYLSIYEGTSALGTQYCNLVGSNLTVGPFTSVTGPLTIVFTSDGSVSYAGYELHVSCVPAPSCPPISTVSVHDVAVASAMASWSYQAGGADAPQSYELAVVDSTGLATPYTTTNMYYLLSNLAPESDYIFKVRTVCEDNVYGDWDSVAFRTGAFGCTQVDSTHRHLDTIAGGTTTNSYLPSYSFYNYGLSQQIYRANELSGSCMIQSLDWEIGTVAQSRHLDIYMANVPDSSVSTWITPSQMTLVWSGNTNFTANSWNTITFTTPFQYNGQSNLLVMVNDHTGSYISGNASKVHSIGSLMSRYIYQDGSAYNPQNPSSAGSGSSLNVRQNVIFHGDSCTAHEQCAAPNVFVSDILAHQATVIWAPGYQETSWEVAHKATTDATWTIDQASTSNTTYTITGLTANTEYQFRITGACSGSNFETIKTASTPCEAVTTFPFTENFDTWPTGTSGAFDACWHRGTNYSYQYYPYVNNSYAHSGANSVYMYSTSNTYSYITLPMMGVSVDSLQVSFSLYRNNTSYTHALNVGVMTDPTDISTQIGRATSTHTLHNTLEAVAFPLSNYAGTGRYIAIMSPNTAYCYPYLDDVEVNYIPTCPRPTAVASTAISQTGATITWSDTNTTNFEIEYGPAGFTHGTGTVVTSSTQSVVLTGLTHSTNYNVYVRGICTGNDTSYWSFAHTFATSCGPIDHLPYTENFNNWGTGTAVHGPNCWSNSSTYSTTYPYITTNTAISTSPFLYMYCYNNPTYNYYTYGTLPMLDSATAAVNQVQLVFDMTRYSNTTAYAMKLVARVTTTPGSFTATTFTPIDTVDCPAYGTWGTFEVPFDTYTGSGKYITFYETASSSQYTYAYSYIALDNMVVEAIPTCRRPIELTATTSTQSSVILGWTERSNATAWVIEYGPRGFALGTGTQVATTSNPFTLTGLPSSYIGEYYVRAVCTPNSDSSEYSRTACAFSTTQVPATVPYNYDFESATEWANWQNSSNNTIHWQRGAAGSSTLGTGTNGMYVTGNDSTATYVSGVNNVTTYRDIDFGTTDSSFIVAFDAMMGGSPDARYDGLMVFLVDPSIPVISSSSNITSPWGNVNNLYRIANLRVTDLNNGGWTHFEGIFDTISGIHRVAFFWFNQATTFNGEMGKVDNISVTYAACPRPVALQANPTDVSAALTWVGPSSASYEIIYRAAGATTNTFAYSNTNSYTLTGLSPLTTYNCWVRKLCGSDTSLTCDGIAFTTDLCAGAVNDTVIGTGSTISEYLYPLNNFYNYTYTQTIVDSAELSGAMDYSAIAYQYNGTTSVAKTNVDIYLGHTTQSTFNSSTDFLPIDSMTLVYSGPLNCSAGWNLFGFDTVFSYDGVRNLVIAVDDNSGDYDGTAYTFAATACTGNKTIYAYSDSYNPVPSSMSGYSGTTSTVSSRVNMQLIACGAGCRVPVVTSENHTYGQSTITWTGEGTNYEVAVKTVAAATWPAETAVAAYTYTFTGLNPATSYMYRVRQICDSVTTSDWTIGTFITDSLPCFAPTALTATAQGTTADIDWTPGTTETAWIVNVYNSTFNQSYAVTAHPYTVTGLTPDVTYNVKVSAICGNATDTSDWSTPISFATESCDPVTNVAVSSLTSTSATITWTAGENNTGSWQLEYGYAGFGQGEGTTINATTNSATISGLTAGVAYDVYVRAICGEGYNSNWSTKVTFTPVGIENVTGGTQLNLYPNPTTGLTTISLSGVQGSVTLTIVDMSGRTVKTETMECSGDCAKKLDVDNLSQGAYFVRVNGENVNVVKKLIVK